MPYGWYVGGPHRVPLIARVIEGRRGAGLFVGVGLYPGGSAALTRFFGVVTPSMPRTTACGEHNRVHLLCAAIAKDNPLPRKCADTRPGLKRPPSDCGVDGG